MFSAICRGLAEVLQHSAAPSPTSLRTQVVDYICNHAREDYQGLPFSEWMSLSRGLTMAEYGVRMEKPHGLDAESWGGALEASVAANLHQVSVHIFEAVIGGFEQIAHAPGSGGGEGSIPRSVCIVWNGVHYDWLDINRG
jgi:hypothetical protein